ncbi:MAG: hypothetical protein KC502_21605, partial [Myxococcales bacterium]|nr:hypothetical protein [Myxococcales bacterium]
MLQTTLHLGEVGGLCKTAAATVDACMTADKKWRAAAANPALRFGGRYAWVGGVCVDQEATTKSQCGAGSSWQHGASFRGITTLAAPCSSSSGSACAAPWKAFFDLPSAAPTALRTAVFGTVTGAAWVHGGKAVLQIGSPVTSALTGGAIVLAASGKTSLISLTKPAVRGRLSADGAWTPNIVGDTSFSLARNSWATLKVIAKVAGTVDPKSPNRLILSGLLLPQSCNAGQTSCTWPTVEPVKASIGAGVFAVDNKAGRLDLSVPFASAKGLDLTAELTNNAAVKLPGNAKVKLESHVFAVWPRNSGTGVLSATPEYNFVAPLPQASIKVGPFTITFGKAMNAKGLIETRPTVLVVSTHGAKGLKLDLDGAAANGKETSWDVPAGATVRSTALIPHMKPFFPNNTATVDLSWVAPAKFKIKGSFKAKVPMIRPEYGVPAIRSLDLTQVFVELTLPSGDIVIGGKAALQVYDRAKKVSHL